MPLNHGHSRYGACPHAVRASLLFSALDETGQTSHAVHQAPRPGIAGMLRLGRGRLAAAQVRGASDTIGETRPDLHTSIPLVADELSDYLDAKSSIVPDDHHAGTIFPAEIPR